jgi:hypothetical protein
VISAQYWPCLYCCWEVGSKLFALVFRLWSGTISQQEQGGSMTFDIIGAGFGRTGTLSLKGALEHLGFGPCYHMVEVFKHPAHAAYWGAAARGQQVDWAELLRGYRSGVDWPLCSYYKELSELFPEAKVILSVREPYGWFKSLHNTIFSQENTAGLLSESVPADTQSMMHKIMIETFDGKNDVADHAVKVFRDHIEQVKADIEPERLLIYEVGSGWEPLCEFLNVAVPSEPYPSVNSTAEFQSRSGGIHEARPK